MNLFGADIPSPLIGLLLIVIFLFVVFGQSKSLKKLRKDDKKLGYQLSIAKKRRELRQIEDEERAKRHNEKMF